MSTTNRLVRAKFSVGELVHHRLFDYRGVIFDVDPHCMASDEWYDQVALSRPPKDQPWYHVLVDNAVHTTYVAERNLEPDDSDDPVENPQVDELFAGFVNGRYVRGQRSN